MVLLLSLQQSQEKNAINHHQLLCILIQLEIKYIPLLILFSHWQMLFKIDSFSYVCFTHNSAVSKAHKFQSDFKAL